MLEKQYRQTQESNFCHCIDISSDWERADHVFGAHRRFFDVEVVAIVVDPSLVVAAEKFVKKEIIDIVWRWDICDQDAAKVKQRAIHTIRR